jgi:hypothetical protein
MDHLHSGDNVGDIAGMGADLSNVTKGGREGSRLVRGWGRES